MIQQFYSQVYTQEKWEYVPFSGARKAILELL